ncbi:trypsin Inhibitor like cysteine rich domain protein [Ancylostoma duodenale]|uniref:Trypsin Inhibitor like cysteine rich domain protein n=1 Tax=Ancylostoma duodenale TaxID=51022 RepID=A0A0C2DFJ5_9BILA|nr:trypsin Inhibitor like cysteine rich domain protein [Ancylostoma duodenale]
MRSQVVPMISLFILVYVYADTECPANEVYDACGKACEPACNDPHPVLCLPSCFAGCKCKDGFFRNEKDECVKECPGTSTTKAP